jgi:hypothetical protein
MYVKLSILFNYFFHFQSHIEDRQGTWKAKNVTEKFCKLFAKYRLADATEDNIQVNVKIQD